MSILVSIAAFLILSIFCLSLLWLILVVIRASLRLFVPSGITGLTARGVVIAFGITAVLFSDTTNTLVRGPISLMIDAFVLFARASGDLMAVVFDSETFDDAANATLRELREFAPELANRGRELLYQISFPALAAAGAVFLMLASAISGTADSSLVLRLRDSYTQLNASSRGRYGLAVTLLAGSYLSLAAIISLPWLQVPDAADPRNESEFRLQLSNAARSEREFQEQWPEALIPSDLLESLPDSNASSGHPAASSVAQHVASVREAIAERNVTWLDLKENASAKRLGFFEQALTTYRRHTAADSATHLSEREREIFRDDLARWYGYAVHSIDVQLRDYRATVRWEVEYWRDWAISARTALAAGKSDVNAPPHGSAGEILGLTAGFRNIGQPPSPREVAGLGFFGFFAKWLVAQRSLSLALLFGTLGFGLVGAVVARALTPPTSATMAPPRGTGDVLLVGVSASVIIFLAAQGGLALLAGGEPRPNPYILFLAGCVGAAYGDRIWEAARIRLFRAIEEFEKKQKDAADSGASPVVASSPAVPGTPAASSTTPAPSTGASTRSRQLQKSESDPVEEPDTETE